MGWMGHRLRWHRGDGGDDDEGDGDGGGDGGGDVGGQARE